MKRLFLILTLCFALFSTLANAQEVCNNNLDDDGDGLVDCLDDECGAKPCEVCDNGVDDDGDGFIDCYDKECNMNAACQGFFLGNGQCDEKPENFYPLQVKLKYVSPVGLTNHVSRVVAGDIDSDGTTDLLTTYNDGASIAKVNVLNAPAAGTSLNLKSSMPINTTVDGLPYDDIATADINGDGCAEIFVVTERSLSSFRILAYDCNGNSIWAAPISLTYLPGLIGLADFDHDGLVELYSRTQIFDAHTGQSLGSNNIDNVNTGIHAGINKGWYMNSNAPIAVDILPENPGLELVAGCRIYGVNINRAAMTATLPLLKEVPSYGTRTSRIMGNETSVADFNLDGSLDVIASGSDGAYDFSTTIFFWDVKSNAVKKYHDNSISGSGYVRGWKNGTGRISIADVDGDTLLNAVYVSGKYLYALKETTTGLDTLWREPVTEETSGYTGCTVFDLNGDGRVEIIYRDEDNLWVFQTDENGRAWRIAPIRCPSRTYNEYPIVTDVDGDGAAEICVTCSSDPNVRGKDQLVYSPSELRVYESANEPWLPARKVWNQHGYFTVNVNDDLTIPRYQQSSELIYAKDVPCRDNVGASRPMNAFLNQAAFLNASGCPAYPAANLGFVSPFPGEGISYKAFECGDNTLEVTLRYVNHGDAVINRDLKISFYNGDPQGQNPVATRLATKLVEVSDMFPGSQLQFTTTVEHSGSPFTLWAVLNDDGTTLPLNITAQSQRVLECDYSNNVILMNIIPTPISLVASETSHNTKCITPGEPLIPDNGAVTVNALVDGVPDNSTYNFYWSRGVVPKPLGEFDFTGHTVAGLSAGPYVVYGVHKTNNCNSDTTAVVVQEAFTPVNAKVVVEHVFDNPAAPNGVLKVVVNDSDNDGVGDPATNFTYEWYNGPDVEVGSALGTDHVLTGLSAGTYSVIVTHKQSNCAHIVTASLENILSTEDGADVFGVTMYPNPGADGFMIEIKNDYIGDVSLQLQSALGNDVGKISSVRKGKSVLKIPVDAHKFESGVYLVKLSFGKQTVTKKWVKR